MKNRIDAKDLIERSLSRLSNMTNHKWAQAHVRRWKEGLDRSGDGYTNSLVLQITGWAEYADAYFSKYDSTVVVGKDMELGPAWESIGEGLLALLNGDRGGLDRGTTDALIREIMEHNGIDKHE